MILKTDQVFSIPADGDVSDASGRSGPGMSSLQIENPQTRQHRTVRGYVAPAHKLISAADRQQHGSVIDCLPNEPSTAAGKIEARRLLLTILPSTDE